MPRLLAATHQNNLDNEVLLVGALQPVILWGSKGRVKGRPGVPVGIGDLPPGGWAAGTSPQRAYPCH